MKFSSTPGIAFGLSHLLGEKMRLSHLLSSTSDSTSLNLSPPSAYLVTRCPSFTAPQLDQNDACSWYVRPFGPICARALPLGAWSSHLKNVSHGERSADQLLPSRSRAPDSGLALCPIVPGSRSNAICVEDLRDGKRVATCGLEYHTESAWASMRLVSNPAGDEDTSEKSSPEAVDAFDEEDESEDYEDQDEQDGTFRCPDGFHQLVTGQIGRAHV